MSLSDITPLIITFNEEANISRTIEKLYWVEKIVVIDSGSTDNTLNILKSHKGVEIYHRSFDTFAGQCNFGLSKIKTEWVLSMDADYVLSEDFIEELKNIMLKPQYDGYSSSFKYCINGRPLRADNTSPRQVLYRLEKAHYIEDGHQHRVVVNGRAGKFRSYILHDDRKSLSRWLSSQDKYLSIEAEKIVNTNLAKLDTRDKIRSVIIASPVIIPFYCLFYKGLILDGWHGLYYTFQRSLVEILLSVKLIEKKFY
jgi:glycosyltransferase involved in cell wall biosynthesis